MKWWHLILIALCAMLILRFGLETSAVSADEVDALAAGSHFGSQVRQGASLKQAFLVDANHPRVKRLKGKHVRRRVAMPPLVRWTTGSAILLGGAEVVPASSARWAAACLIAVALLFLLLLMRPRGQAASWIALGVLLLSSGVVEAGTAYGSAALGAAITAVLFWALEGLRKGERTVLIGVCWGLLLGVHPAALFLLIPIFVSAALRLPRPDTSIPTVRSGRLALPPVPLTFYLFPVIGLVVLFLIAPNLRPQSGQALVSWLGEIWMEPLAPQTIEGVMYHQTAGRSPHAFTGWVQWVGLLSLPVLVAWITGVVVALREGRSGHWTPIVWVVTLLMVAGINGGLWGGRLSILSLIWVPAAITITEGVLALGHALSRGLKRRAVVGTSIVAIAILGAAALRAGVGTYQTGPPNGLASRVPIPVSLIEKLANEHQKAPGKIPIALLGADTAVPSENEKWRYGAYTLAKHADLPVALTSVSRAQWLLVMPHADLRKQPATEKVRKTLAGAPQLEMTAGGVTWRAYSLK